MARFSGYRQAVISILLSVVFAAAADAQAACPEAEVGACFQKYESIPAVMASTSGFTAAAVSNSSFDLLRLTADADIRETKSIPLPQWMTSEGSGRFEVQKLVAGPDDSVLVIGWTSIGAEDARQVGAIALVDGDGQATWSRPLEVDAETSVVLYSGVYDAAGDRFIVVGRHTSGVDQGKCTAWSQGLMLSVPRTEVSAPPAPHLEGVAAAGPKNRIAFYDIVKGASEGQFVVAGFGTSRAATAGACQDDVLALQMDAKGNGWTRGNLMQFGLNDVNELAFGLVADGNGEYGLVGYGATGAKAARAALVARFAFGGGAPDVRYHPYPEDRTDATGGDRYRVIASTSSGYIVAGSRSERREARNKAVWRALDSSLDAAGDAVMLTTEAGSEILAAAVGAGGRILATGTHADSDGANIGWLGIIQPAIAAAGHRREPDAQLPQLSEAELAAGSATISSREVMHGAGLRGGPMKASSRLQLKLEAAESIELAAYGLPSNGDIDMALVDDAGRLMAYSSHLGDAGEYLKADLSPGHYTLHLVAASDLDAFEVRVARGGTLESAAQDRLLTLGKAQRQLVSSLLENAGYGRAGNPDIGLGMDTVRAVIAYYNTFEVAADGGDMEQFVVSAMLGSQGN